MSEHIKDIIEILIQALLLPIILVLTKYLVSFLNQKINHIKQQHVYEKYSLCITTVDKVICDSVSMVFQTYVKQLKESGSFDENAQKEALKRAKVNIIQILDEDTMRFLQENIKNLDPWLETKIECRVCKNK